MSRTDNTVPYRLLESGDHPLAYWHDGLQDWVLPYRVFVNPPRWYIHREWTGGERQRERDDLRDMAREYNAAGDLADGDFACWQHRHQATYYWW